jgi:transposase InsO family protein
MKTIADTLGVARSNLIEHMNRPPRQRSAYRKADDAWLLPLVRAIVDARPTYGYRRVGALLNRQLAALGKPAVNHKRRLMKQNGLLLARHTGTGRQRAHDGVVRTLRSNLRWCSDVFEVPCWNDETVRVAFVLDTCDREAITWTATTSGIAGEQVRDLMVEAIERRFGSVTHAPHAIEWLTDNGSAYTAHDTVAYAHALGLVP